MTSLLIAGPGEEPVSLAEAKAWLRVDGTAEDALIATLIAAARMHVESISGRALIAQSWRLLVDSAAGGSTIVLPVGPVMAVTAVTAGAVVLAVETVGEFVTLPAGGLFTEIAIDYRAGYGAHAAEVPADLRQAMLLLVAYWYENRDAVIVAGSGAVVPSGFDRVVSGYKRVRL